MANRDFFQNGRWFREITYGSGSTKIVPLDGPYKSNPSIGQGFAEDLYGRTPGSFQSRALTTLPTLGARSSFDYRPTSASAGQGLYRLPVRQIPSSGEVYTGLFPTPSNFAPRVSPVLQSVSYDPRLTIGKGIQGNLFSQGSAFGYAPTTGTSLIPVPKGGALVPTGLPGTTRIFDSFFKSGNAGFGAGEFSGFANQSPFRSVPSGGLQGNLFAPNGGYVGNTGGYSQYNRIPSSGNVFYGGYKGISETEPFGVRFDRYRNLIGNSPVNVGAFRPILGGLGIAASALADPTFNQNVLVPSISGGVGLKLLQNFAVTPFFQQLGKSNTFGFSRAEAGIAGLKENTTLFRGNPFKATLPSFGQTVTALTAINAANNLFSTNVENVRAGRAAAGGLIGSELGGTAFGLIGALSGNPYVAGGASLLGSLGGGYFGASAGGNLPVNQQLYKVAQASLATQGIANQANYGALSQLVKRPEGLQRLAEPLATALDFGFVAGPITDYPKKLAGLPTRGDVQSTLGQISLDARTGIGAFAGSGLNIASRFARVAFAQGEGIGGPNPFYAEQGIGGYTRGNSLAEAVSGVRLDLYQALKDQKYSNRDIAALQAQFQQETRQLYGLQAQSLRNLQKQQTIEANRAFFNDVPSRVDQGFRPVKTASGGTQYRLDPKVNAAVAADLRKIPATISAQKPGFFQALFSNGTAAGIKQQNWGTGIDRFIGDRISDAGNAIAGLSRNSVISDIKRDVGLKEAAKTGTLAQRIESISKDAQNTAAIARGTNGAGGGGYYNRGPSPYQQAMLARQARQDADRFAEAKGRYVASSFESRFNAIDFPVIDRPQLNTYGYNADLPNYGTVTASQFLESAKQSYQTNIIDDLKGKRDAAYEQAAPALKQIGALRSQQLASYQSEINAAPSPTAKLNIAANLEKSLSGMDKVVRTLTKSLQAHDTTLLKATENLEPFTADSLSQYTKGTFARAPGDIRATDQSRRYILRDDLNQQQFQLKQDQQLGLISTSRFLEKDFANERTALGYRQAAFDQDVLLRKQQVDIYKSLADAEKDPEKKAYYQTQATALEASVNAFQTQGQASLDALKANFTPQQLAAQQRLVARKEISTNLQPFTNALVSGAYGGGVSGAITQFGTAGKNAIAGITNSVFADAIQSYSAKVPGLQNILTGGLGDLPRNVADFFAMRSAPGGIGPVVGNGGGIFARGYQNLSNPANVSKVIGAGAVGTLASQYVLNQFPYANRGVSNVGNLAGTAIGGLLGGPIGAGIGAFAGGLIGAAPFTQNPVGGGLTGALAGAAGGFAFGGPIGALIGGIGGGILGLFGGKQAQEKKKQDKELARQQKLADQANGRNFAKSQIGLGADLASDLFDGYGTLAPKQSALTQFLGGSKLEAAASQQGLTGDALSAARSEFKRLGTFFKPVQALADKYASTLDRPGGFQGAIYDETLKTQQIINRSPSSQQGAIGQLASTFESLRSNLGQYGFDTTRAQLAQNTFYSQYQNQLRDVDYNIGVADRNFQDTNKQIQINRLSRGIQRDVLNKQYNEFDSDSQKSIESALGTLQRRENRAGVVAKLKEDQAFQKDILGRQLDVFNKSSDLQQGQEFYQQQDALKNLDDLIGSRKALTDGFNELAPKLANAGDEFYKLNDAVKEVTRALEELSRNLRY